MAGAARDARRQVARFGLLALLSGCAKIEAPPGGPPDFAPPVIISITPDSGAVVEDFREDFEIRFDEVIAEAGAGGLDNLVLVAPRPEQTEVSWKRSRVTVRPKGGWRQGTIYHLKILPGFADLRDNRLDSTITIVFSTGPPIPATRLTGTVIDWEAGRTAPRALVEAVLLPDSLVYFIQADSSGNYNLAAVPSGRYQLFATIDGNSNRRRDLREAFDSVTVELDSALSHVFWTFAHDTTGPRITNLLQLDSITVQVEFSQMLIPSAPTDSAVQVFALPDTVPVAVAAVWPQEVYDSVRTVETAIADSLRRLAAAAEVERADSLVTDSLRADSARVDSAAVPLRLTDDTTGAAEPDSAAADTSRVAALLAQRPKLGDAWFVRLEVPLAAGARYLVVTYATNLSEATLRSVSLLVTQAPDSI